MCTEFGRWGAGALALLGLAGCEAAVSERAPAQGEVVEVQADAQAKPCCPQGADADDEAEAVLATRTQRVELPGVSLVARGGESMPLAGVLAGPGPVFVQFIFTTCPTICPISSASFAALQEQPELPAGARLVSISIDPEHDTPARLRSYAETHGVGAQWELYTGALGEIVEIQERFDVYRGNKMRHEPVTFVRRADGAWLRIEGFATGPQLFALWREHAAA